jgi:hypothetical protein
MNDPVIGLLILLLSFTIIMSPLLYTWCRGRAVGYRTAVMLACTPLLGFVLAIGWVGVLLINPAHGQVDWPRLVYLLALAYGFIGWFLSVPLGLLLAIYVSLRNRFRSRANRFEVSLQTARLSAYPSTLHKATHDPSPALIDALAEKIIETGSIERAARDLGIDEDLLDAWWEVGGTWESAGHARTWRMP